VAEDAQDLLAQQGVVEHWTGPALAVPEERRHLRKTSLGSLE
jgi:hypothetical protein